MLPTRLYMHVLTTQPIAITDIHFLADHVMVPLTKGRAHRFMVDGKKPHPQTSSGSSSSPSPTPNLGEVNPVDNYTLDPIVYMNQLPPIPEDESVEFKQTKGMFKCFGHFLSNLGKKKKKLTRANVIDISSNESSPLQEKNFITTTITTTLALSLTPPNASQTFPSQPIEASPLAPRALVYYTLPSSPIKPHPYLNSLDDLPPRSLNPPPPPLNQNHNQTPLQTTLMDFEPFSTNQPL
ncbi:hypothetical protein Tco_0523305 [Tanacetum coccineum]